MTKQKTKYLQGYQIKSQPAWTQQLKYTKKSKTPNTRNIAMMNKFGKCSKQMLAIQGFTRAIFRSLT